MDVGPKTDSDIVPTEGVFTHMLDPRLKRFKKNPRTGPVSMNQGIARTGPNTDNDLPGPADDVPHLGPRAWSDIVRTSMESMNVGPNNDNDPPPIFPARSGNPWSKLRKHRRDRKGVGREALGFTVRKTLDSHIHTICIALWVGVSALRRSGVGVWAFSVNCIDCVKYRCRPPPT